jgi:hypothetical protein
MTYAEMAIEIERRRPGTLPKDIGYVSSVGSLTLSGYNNVGVPMRDMVLRDGIAAAILRDAMVMALGAKGKRIRYDVRGHGWSCRQRILEHDDIDGINVRVWDADHGNDPTASLFAAFCEVFP